MRFDFYSGAYNVHLTYDNWRAVYECFGESVNAWSDEEAEILGCIEFWSKAIAEARPSTPSEQVTFPMPDVWLRLLVHELATAPDTDGCGGGYDWVIKNLHGQVVAQNRRKRQ